ncbi:MAG: tRNA pseudouridine(38-40) synthase TruA [Xanthomonadales bacterium]|nr:tRNA pseudouridine(38-40) synthase TruA [Xanthomonadales bacterium]
MRWALGIEYDGSAFLGWQRLSHGPTVQGAVEAALSFVADSPIEVTCAGRTDSGVHAVGQVVHFDSDVERTPYAWMMGANTRLPAQAAITWAMAVDDQFHARFSALSRHYRYRILQRPARPALDARRIAWERRTLDVSRMHDAAQSLLGEHDFSAFRTAQCQARHPNRELQAISVQRCDDEVVIDVQANAFLHHMVRNIVGSLLPIGRGEQPVSWMAELLKGRDRSVAGPTAVADGLCFLGPRYPERFGLPAAHSIGAV